MRKQLIVLIGGILGAFLLVQWWDSHKTLIHLQADVVFWAAAIGLMAFPLAMGFQVDRTRRLLNMTNGEPIIRPILMAHGINILLPSMLGDLYEIGALARSSGLPKHTVLVRLIHRFGTTISALMILAAFAMGTASPSLGFPVLVIAILGPLMLDATTPKWSKHLKLPGAAEAPRIRSLGVYASAQHILLALTQHACSAAGIFFIGIAVGEAISPAVAAAMLSLADLVTYLPVPIGGMGVHHWTTIRAAEWLGSIPASLVAINHAWIVVGGIICIALANWVFDRAK